MIETISGIVKEFDHLRGKKKEIGEIMEGGKPEKQPMDFETGPVNPHDLGKTLIFFFFDS